MSRHTFSTSSAAHMILEMSPKDPAEFVRSSIKSRSLSSTIGELNRDLVDGTPHEKELARKALQKLGFL